VVELDGNVPYEMPRLRSGVPSLKEEERQKVRKIDQFMKELSLCNGNSEICDDVSSGNIRVLIT